MLQVDAGQRAARWPAGRSRWPPAWGHAGRCSAAGALARATRVAALELLGAPAARAAGENFAQLRRRSCASISRRWRSTPRSADLRYALGEIHLAAGRQQEALTALPADHRARPASRSLARFALGQAYLLTGDPTNAAQAVRELEDAAGAGAPHAAGASGLGGASTRRRRGAPLARDRDLDAAGARLPALWPGRADADDAAGGQRSIARATTRSTSAGRRSLGAAARSRRRSCRSTPSLSTSYRANRQVENAVLVLREMERARARTTPPCAASWPTSRSRAACSTKALAELRALADIYMRRGAAARRGAGLPAHGRDLLGRATATTRWPAAPGDSYATDDMQLRQQFVQYCLEIGATPRRSSSRPSSRATTSPAARRKEAVAALQQLIAMDKHELRGLRPARPDLLLRRRVRAGGACLPQPRQGGPQQPSPARACKSFSRPAPIP